ncbi:hypothetical protein ASPWEDRAFT_730458 [Aspergillus wentii DTO 134E9]|uniref:Uncharacterized protein n=1 Tax=Aspergillus wentii DTO 134E9 TaxID=1073089 RepID=A0A1L9RYZ0_ASPWE|nr:uncharacterized protein ASPWEDRAFT_730458 [Aspergillus wentii DTO 134E9]KAI9932583.1 hypothetical protein MW887_008828 [Aspergillus wentii]OJJ40149.1 hypothetical protein ASPWEDRAFT_730458 [Aspergillus wentii DTO 134E9]
MPEYSLEIANDTTKALRFVLYQENPFESTDGFANIWMAANVFDGASRTWVLDTNYYAWAGTNDQPVSDNVTIRGGKTLPATLGTGAEKGSTFETTVEPDKGRKPQQVRAPGTVNVNISDTGKPDAGPGDFQILTKDDFNVGSDVVIIGLGKRDENNTPVPVATINADPSKQYNLKPILKGSIVQSDSGQVGQALKYSSISRDAGLVDFTSPEAEGKFHAQVRFNEKGKFEKATYW